jgi:hypothetical protein
MLDLEGNTGPKRSGPFTENKLFAPQKVPCTANSPSADPNAHEHGSGSDAARKSPADGNDDDDDDQKHDSNSNVNLSTLPPMLPDGTLAQEISSLQIATVDKWRTDPKAIVVFKLFALLVNPPPHLHLDSIPGLPIYLTTLCNAIGKLPVNGVRFFATRCWSVLHGECSTSAYARKP